MKIRNIASKSVFGFAAAAVVIVMAPLVAAFEAHVLSVTAQIANAVLTVPSSLTFGTVFPQERLEQTFDVALSESFLNEPIGTQCASGVVSFSQGVRNNGTAVLPDRSNPVRALGLPQSTGAPFDSPVIANSFVSLGFASSQPADGGSLVLSFTNFVVNGPGNDITVYEVTGGPPYPDEKIRLEASMDGVNWVVLSAALTKDGGVDLGAMPWAKFVRLTDVSDYTLFEPEADGYDVDAVCATSRQRVGVVNYVLRQKPKCGLPVADTDPVEYSAFGYVTEDEEGNFECADEGYVMLPLLCPYLSKHEVTGDPTGNIQNDSPNGLTAFHGLPGPWTPQTAEAFQVPGALSRPLGDLGDSWLIDLKVPCFAGSCAQDWPSFVVNESGNEDSDPELYKADPALEHQLFGCDLWVETTSIQ